MFTLDLARARIIELQREAARDSAGIDVTLVAGRLRRLVHRKRVDS
jgi:hypothetical protein